MRVLDSASGLLSRLQELAVLGANDTNTEADAEAIDREFNLRNINSNFIDDPLISFNIVSKKLLYQIPNCLGYLFDLSHLTEYVYFYIL